MEKYQSNIYPDEQYQDRIKNANSYLSSKNEENVKLLIIAGILSIFMFFLIIASYKNESYFLLFIFGILLIFFVISFISGISESLKLKKYIEQIYKNIDVLEKVELLIEKDNKIKAKMSEEQAKRLEFQQAQKEHNYKLEHPKCPNCNGHNTKRISTVNRAVSVGTLGLASSKIGKTFECFDCKYKW